MKKLPDNTKKRIVYKKPDGTEIIISDSAIETAVKAAGRVIIGIVGLLLKKKMSKKEKD
jgi:hypothetical protein